MNKITPITRKEIFSLLAHGYKESSFWGEETHLVFCFYGTLSCVDFLGRLYNLEKLLGNLSAIAEGMATLRNNYGSGHGKPASYKGLEERHAKLAVGSSITLVEFLWCTHERTKNDTKF